MQPTVAIAQSLSLINQTLRHNLTKTVSEKRFSRQLMEISAQTVDELSVLPLLTCEVAGGDSRQAIPLMAAWQLLRLSAKLLDDVIDRESEYPTPEAVNLATGLLFLAPLVLGELQNYGVSTRRIERLTKSLHQTGFRACAGQYAEITPPTNVDPDGWLLAARAKSGNLCAWASWAGAMIATTNKETLADFCNFGLHMGILLQVADDFNGIWQPTKSSDLRSEQLNLAVCYARLAAQAEQKHCLETLSKRAIDGDDMVESEIRQFLIAIGAQAYMLAVGYKQRLQALTALSKRHGPYPILVNMLNQIWPILGEVQTDGSHYSKQA